MKIRNGPGWNLVTPGLQAVSPLPTDALNAPAQLTIRELVLILQAKRDGLDVAIKALERLLTKREEPAP